MRCLISPILVAQSKAWTMYSFYGRYGQRRVDLWMGMWLEMPAFTWVSSGSGLYFGPYLFTILGITITTDTLVVVALLMQVALNFLWHRGNRAAVPFSIGRALSHKVTRGGLCSAIAPPLSFLVHAKSMPNDTLFDI